MTGLTVDDMIQRVRDVSDEFNTAKITDARLLRALNSSQDHAMKTIAIMYEDAFTAEAEITMASGTTKYPLPVDAFGGRVLAVFAEYTGQFYELEKKSNTTKLFLRSSNYSVTVPYKYSISRNTIEVLHSPATSLTLTIL